jgi:hypothetical protein
MAANPISLAPDDEFAELLDDFLASQLSPLTRSSICAWFRRPADAQAGESCDSDGKS